MQKFLTDVHTHSAFSYDGVSPLEDMLQSAMEKGIAFYGVSEHFDYDVKVLGIDRMPSEKADEYFHAARHLQEDYAGCMNVLIGAEFGFIDDKTLCEEYAATAKKYTPDFIVNSIHTYNGHDYYDRDIFYKAGVVREKKEVYTEYLTLVLKSLHAPYPYDIVGHIGYPTRYAPYENTKMPYAEYAELWDSILQTVIAKDKILEINVSGGRGTLPSDGMLPSEEILKRYFALGGRKISYASDAHQASKIAANRESVIKLLKEIGFTHITVPCKGEHIKVEI